MKTSTETKTKETVVKKADPVVHFEMPVEDRERMAKFYEEAFGWQAQMLGEEFGNYVLVTTADEVDKDGVPKKPGIINGGFYPKDLNNPAQYPTVVIAVNDIKRAMKKIEQAGGKILGEPMEIPGYGLYVSFFDSEGNRASIMEARMN
jgi:uncharacterized protein